MTPFVVACPLCAGPVVIDIAISGTAAEMWLTPHARPHRCPTQDVAAPVAALSPRTDREPDTRLTDPVAA